MVRICKIVLISIFLCIIVPLKCNAMSYTKIDDLIQKSSEYNNKTITIKAEAIGEPLNRGSFTWINVNDGSNAIGIWMNSDEAKRILKYGNYKERGDVIEVTGVYHKNCTEHGGDVDIHADSIRVTEKGYFKNEPIEKIKAELAIMFILTTVLLSSIYLKKVRS